MLNKSSLCMAIERLIANNTTINREKDIKILYKNNMLTKDEYDFLLKKIDNVNK